MEMISPLAGIGIFMFFMIFMGIMLLPQIFFLLTLHRTFDEISPENRLMPSAQVWLALIPFFGMIWNLIIVQRLADSLQKEFEKRNLQPKEPRPAYNVGMAWAIMGICTIVPFFGFLAAMGSFICWIIYWVNVYDYKSQLVRARIG